MIVLFKFSCIHPFPNYSILRPFNDLCCPRVLSKYNNQQRPVLL